MIHKIKGYNMMYKYMSICIASGMVVSQLGTVPYGI